MNKRIVVLVCGVAVCVLLGGLNSALVFSSSQVRTDHGYGYTVVPTPQWWDSNWSYVKRIVVNHTRVLSDLVDFPVLVSEASDPDLAAHAQDGGGDIVFVDSLNLTRYPHELEKFDGDSGELQAWVRIPILSSSSDTIMFMYYGNSGCGNQQNVSGVWDDDFAGVWHMPDVTTSTINDSTTHGNNGVKTSVGSPVQVLGKIDGSQLFDGNDDRITIANSTSLNPAVFTLEYWLRNLPPQSGDFFARMTGKTKGFETAIDSNDDYGNDDVSVYFYDGIWHDTGFDAVAGTWYYLVWMYDGDTVALSVNGTEVYSLSGQSVLLNGDLALGNVVGSLQGLSGGLDEARLSRVVRSDDWIGTCFQTMNEPESFLSFGPEATQEI